MRAPARERTRRGRVGQPWRECLRTRPEKERATAVRPGQQERRGQQPDTGANVAGVRRMFPPTADGKSKAQDAAENREKAKEKERGKL